MERITFNKDQYDGQPCIRGMRIRVVDILDNLAAGETEEQLLELFPYLEAEDIKAALAYASHVLSHQLRAA